MRNLLMGGVGKRKPGSGNSRRRGTYKRQQRKTFQSRHIDQVSEAQLTCQGSNSAYSALGGPLMYTFANESMLLQPSASITLILTCAQVWEDVRKEQEALVTVSDTTKDKLGPIGTTDKCANRLFLAKDI